MPDATDPQRRAELARDILYERDHASRSLGIAIVEVGPGRCVATMTVRRDMLNSFDICHGGFVTALADTAFAYASGSHGEKTVASGFDVELVRAAQLDDMLTAHAEQRVRGGRLGLCDVTVRNQHGETVAFLRGRSYRLRGQLPAEP